MSDDGVGFGPSLVREGFGLVGMRERAALLGGTLEVVSTKGAGTRPAGFHSADDESGGVTANAVAPEVVRPDRR